MRLFVTIVGSWRHWHLFFHISIYDLTQIVKRKGVQWIKIYYLFSYSVDHFIPWYRNSNEWEVCLAPSTHCWFWESNPKPFARGYIALFDNTLSSYSFAGLKLLQIPLNTFKCKQTGSHAFNNNQFKPEFNKFFKCITLLIGDHCPRQNALLLSYTSVWDLE